ncbi:MAG: DUF2442 domain-containing protein [Gemmatimonadaceae bacterium]|nr:DUF2442 domain-containing protein [Gemmatimonadaceae bacterium]
MAKATKAEILRQVVSARALEARERRAGRRAVTAAYEPRTGRVMLELSSGFLFGFPTAAIPALARASAQELAEVQLSPGGGALHWEGLDVDLSIPGLLLASVERPARLRELARLAGGTRSTAKAAAARANGAKGGRPRKRERA